jgi:hypothetical protein
VFRVETKSLTRIFGGFFECDGPQIAARTALLGIRQMRLLHYRIHSQTVVPQRRSSVVIALAGIDKFKLSVRVSAYNGFVEHLAFNVRTHVSLCARLDNLTDCLGLLCAAHINGHCLPSTVRQLLA